MSKYHVAWLPGDGVGRDVMQAARIVLDRTGLKIKYHEGDIGWECWRQEGDALPARTIELLGNTDCALFGATTSKHQNAAERELPPALQGKKFIYKSPIVRIRQLFDLYICQRPCKAYPGNSLNYRDDIDLTVFRENTEDLYAGIEFEGVPPAMRWLPGMDRVPADAVIALKVNTPGGCDRIIRAAFEYAKNHDRKRVTCVHKASVLRVTDGLFLDTAQEVAQQYPDLTLDNINVDACCMSLIKHPQDYEVLVAPNFYGDVISDLATELIGGLGFGCTGNIGRRYAVFEPTHGSAPKYAGKFKVNPTATILAAKMMLDWLGESKKADAIDAAITETIDEGITKTADMGGKATTLEMAKAIAEKL